MCGIVATGDKSVMDSTSLDVYKRQFKDFYLKDAIMQAISYCGFEHPSEGILRWSSELVIL